MRQSKPKSRSTRLTWLLATALVLTSCTPAYAQDSRQQKSKPPPTVAEQLRDLERATDRLLVDLEHTRRLLELAGRKERIDAEAIALRDQKIALVELQLANAREAIAALKAAGTADATQIKALKEQVRLADREVERMRFTSGLKDKLIVGALVVGAVLGFLLGARR